MKILIVSEFFPPKVMGGGELSAYSFAKELSKSHKVHVLTGWFPGMKKMEVQDGIRIIRTFDGRHGSAARVMMQFVSMKEAVHDIADEYDIVHAMNSTSIPAVAGCGKPTVATVNSFVSLCPKGNMFYKDEKPCEVDCTYSNYSGCLLHSNVIGVRKLGILTKFNPVLQPAIYMQYKKRLSSLKKIDKVVAVSSSIKHYLKKRGIKSTVIPHVVDVDEDYEEIEGLEKLTKKKFVVSSLSSLEKQKGVDIMLEASNLIDNAVFIVAGKGSLYEKYKKKYPKVHFIGNVTRKQVGHLYAVSDVMTQLSRIPEPLSRILIESAYMGVPVIATDVGGNKDGVDKNGFLINHDPKEFAEAVDKLQRSKTRQKKMQKAAKRIYENNFKKSNILKSYLRVYK